MKRCFWILNLQGASRRDAESLRNWVDGNSCLARDETSFLSKQNDLVSLVAPGDDAVARLGPAVEDMMIRGHKMLAAVRRSYVGLRPRLERSLLYPTT